MGIRQRRRRAVRIGDADSPSGDGGVLYDVVGFTAQFAVSDKRIFVILGAAAERKQRQKLRSSS